MTVADPMKQLQHAQRLAQRGALGEARGIVEAVCRSRRPVPAAWMMLGGIQLQMGDFEHAITSFTHASELMPAAREPRLGLANAYHGLGRRQQAGGVLAQAVESFRQAVRHAPGFAQAHHDLGLACQLAGQLEQAVQAYREAVRVQPDFSLAWYNLGSALRAQGKAGEAIASLREALRLRPDFPEAHNALALNLQQLGRHDEALSRYRAALDRRPDYADALLNLGGLLLGTYYQVEQAQQCFERAIALDPANPTGHYGLGNALRAAGRLEEALQRYQRALELSPGHLDAIAKMAGIYEQRREYAKAHEILQPVLHIPNAEIAIAFAALGRHLGMELEAVRVLEQAQRMTGLDDEQRVELHFARGEIHDAMGHHDLAFTHFEAGNRLGDRGGGRDRDDVGADELIRVYRAQDIAGLPHASVADRQPIFILGMPRSGTSLAEQILASHPQVQAGGELRTIELLVARLRAEGGGAVAYPESMKTMDPARLTALAGEYLHALPGDREGRSFFTDKMPHNFLHLGIIQQLFPNARVVHCVRDPRDTCLSCYFCNFHGDHPYTRDLGRLGHYYREYQRLMDHWCEVLELPFHRLEYERLVSDQETESRRLLEFCGLEWDPRCLNFHESERFVNTASYNQVRRPMYRSSLQRWRHYREHIGPLEEALGGLLPGRAAEDGQG